MQGSRSAREARRRPELDLLVGPLEAATMDEGEPRSDDSGLEDVLVGETAERPTWREDG